MKGKPLESRPECYYRVKERHEGLGEYGPGAVVEGDGRLVPGGSGGGGQGLGGMLESGDAGSAGTAIIANRYGKGGRFALAGAWKGITIPNLHIAEVVHLGLV
jgi:hypothetical protein